MNASFLCCAVGGVGRVWLHVNSASRLVAVFLPETALLPPVIHSEKSHMVSAKTLAPETAEKMRTVITPLDKSGELKRLVEKWERC